jgi:hypothetical protein
MDGFILSTATIGQDVQEVFLLYSAIKVCAGRISDVDLKKVARNNSHKCRHLQGPAPLNHIS